MQGLAKTRTPNLWRHPIHKTYYAVTRVGGKASRAASLKTTSEAIAKLRLPRKLAELRNEVPGLPNLSAMFPARLDRDASLGSCAAVYLARLQKRVGVDLKAKALTYREASLDGLRRTFDGFDTTPAGRITRAVAEQWALSARTGFSASWFNGMLQTFRGVMQVAVEAGGCDANPFAPVPRGSPSPLAQRRVVRKELHVLSHDQVQLVLAALRRRKGSNAYWLVRFLYHFSLRVDTARHLTPAMVDRQAMVFVIPGELVKRRAPGTVVRVPIFPEMLAVLDDLDRAFGKRRKRLLPVGDAKKPLRAVEKELKLDKDGIRLNHHLFRHIFTTNALLNGVQVRLLAQWRGDADNGAFLLKHYAHVRDEVSRAAAAQLKFATEDEKITVLPREKFNHG